MTTTVRVHYMQMVNVQMPWLHEARSLLQQLQPVNHHHFEVRLWSNPVNPQVMQENGFAKTNEYSSTTVRHSRGLQSVSSK